MGFLFVGRIDKQKLFSIADDNRKINGRLTRTMARAKTPFDGLKVVSMVEPPVRKTIFVTLAFLAR